MDMKYNRSEIMKTAWRKYKELGGAFRIHLKMAWDAAKKPVKKVVEKKIIFTDVAAWFLKKMDAVTFMAFESGVAVDDIVLERETEKAIEISTEWNGFRKKIWLPKSVCSYVVA